MWLVPKISELARPQNEAERTQQRLYQERMETYRGIESELNFLAMRETVVPYDMWGNVAPGYEERHAGFEKSRAVLFEQIRKLNMAYVEKLKAAGLHGPARVERKDLGLVLHRY